MALTRRLNSEIHYHFAIAMEYLSGIAFFLSKFQKYSQLQLVQNNAIHLNFYYHHCRALLVIYMGLTSVLEVHILNHQEYIHFQRNDQEDTCKPMTFYVPLSH
ncbi:hypothetical protein BDC45DRAFT_587515 [Circinella umbellata]|nr:hypothetical protein BDC45DRAFT_587515 [Circinella umbellata]